MLKYILVLLSIFLSTTSYAQSWLDVFNRYRIAQASDWLAPVKIPRTDLRPFVTLSRRNQPCSDCRVDELGDAGRFAVAMQGQGSRKDVTPIRNDKGETLLTTRDMEFLRAHAWDGAGKVFIGGTLNSPKVSPQSLVMALVTQIGVRARPLAIGFSDEGDDSLVWAYRLLPIAASDIKEPVVVNGRLVYPVVLRFTIYFHNPIEDATMPSFDFQNSRDQAYAKVTRVGRYTDALTLKTEFTFDQAVEVEQNGYRAQGLGRLIDPGKWVDSAPVDHLWVANSYGSSASEHPALSPKALLLIENGNWNAPELTKRLTTYVSLEGSYDAFPWLQTIDVKKFGSNIFGLRKLIAKKIEHAFHRNKIPVKVWVESVFIPLTSKELMSVRVTFYGNYDQAKVIKTFEQMKFKVDTTDRY